MQLIPNFLPILLILWLIVGCNRLPSDYEVKEGDILFQSLPLNPVVYAIEGVTQSPYSHCGIVTRFGEAWHVLEAIGPVKETPLDVWIDQGRGNRFWAYRLNDELQKFIPKIIEVARRKKGKAYDLQYRFDNDKIYCSELIYMAVKSAIGIELGKIEKLEELNWQPYEDTIVSIQGYVPLDREMITPAALAKAPEMRLVHEPAE